MSDTGRQVYVISDLHLGGAYPPTDDPEDRGFRICTHVADLTRFVSALADKSEPVELVINGDLVDLLAENDEAVGWTPFVADQQAAALRLERIIDRDRSLFTALGAFLDKGHRLTILLGNHDIELALPLVRDTLARNIGVTGRHDFRLLHDGEAYTIGNVLIEHGNRYDKFNVVDYDGLRRVRSLLSRRQEVPPEYAFAPPAGSRMVAEVINPIKAQYRFIDLLKPDSDIVVPILLALEPGYRRVLTKVAELSLAAQKHRLATAAMPSFGGDIASTSSVDDLSSFGADINSTTPAADPLVVVLAGVMIDPNEVLAACGPPTADIGDDISTGDLVDRTLGLARLLVSHDTGEVERRLPALLTALRSLQHDNSFARDAECYREYADAALDLSLGGFDYIVFGHTHLARDMWLIGGGRYLNSGSWADVIKFPKEILAGPVPQALDALRAFVEDVRLNRLSAWISFIPTYVRFDLDADDRVVSAVLCEYTSPAGV